MQLTHEQVVALAHSARLALAPEEIERFRAQLSGVLAELQALDQIDLAETVGAAPQRAMRLRPDEIHPDKLRAGIDTLSADVSAGFFTVPKVQPEAAPAP